MMLCMYKNKCNLDLANELTTKNKSFVCVVDYNHQDAAVK